MPRYRLTIEYDGTPYAGWQAQDERKGVQNVIADAIEAFCGEAGVSINGAGRTDAGVHALGQVAHIDLVKEWEARRVREALNFYMREELVVVQDAERVDESFDARFSATRRLYCYRILNRDAPAALERNFVWHVRDPLDAGLMQQGAEHLMGHHDFTTFRHARCQAKSPMKTLDCLRVERDGEEIRITAEARSFLHNQVRSMVGSLRTIGEGKMPPGWIRSILEKRDRTQCGVVAPAHGLTLMRVDY